MQTNFQSKIISDSGKNGLVYLVTADADGKPAWYYLQVDEPKHKAFLKQMETGTLDLAKYGKILYSGWGTTPPEPIEALMREKFEDAA
jgi:hypothetical protein